MQLTKGVSNICDWFVDNKTKIYFEENKLKSIHFCFRRNLKLVDKLDIRYKSIKVKQHMHV